MEENNGRNRHNIVNQLHFDLKSSPFFKKWYKCPRFRTEMESQMQRTNMVTKGEGNGG